MQQAGAQPGEVGFVLSVPLSVLFWVLWGLFNPTAMDWRVLRLSHAGDMKGLHPAENMAQGGWHWGCTPCATTAEAIN